MSGGSAERRRDGRPRLGFVGVGWIGRQRMERCLADGAAVAVSVADPSPERLAEAAEAAPEAVPCGSFEELLERAVEGSREERLDGIVLATPSALHAEQATAALERGLAVFCQKPIGRTAGETAAVVEAARRADRSLGVDFSYRHTAAAAALRERVAAGAVGRVWAARLVFHNAYGPDKPWFWDRRLAGGGCLVDLGGHLVDLALWTLGGATPEGGVRLGRVEGATWSGGRRLGADGVPLGEPEGTRPVVEDHARARMEVSGGAAGEPGAEIEIACSWKLPLGRDAEIEARFHGTGGTLRLANVGGSFYDLRAEHHRGRETEVLTRPPDDWSGRALVAWARRLAEHGGRFEPEIESAVTVAQAIDRVYGTAGIAVRPGIEGPVRTPAAATASAREGAGARMTRITRHPPPRRSGARR